MICSGCGVMVNASLYAGHFAIYQSVGWAPPTFLISSPPMPDYRRAFLPGGTFFFTLVTYQRRPLFSLAANVEQLREAMRRVRSELPFDLVAAVILPDHLHVLMTLPPGDADYSGRLGRIKAG